MRQKTDPAIKAERMVGRCEMFDEIACGGMATIHLGRMLGAGGFRRTVAIKRLHPQFARDPEFVTMFLDEARIVARIRHPNVIPTIDLVEEDGDLFIIMEYVEGLSFGALMKRARDRGERVPPGVAVRVVHGALHGLHAAHESTDERGRPLKLVHRDVSPDNIFVGTDGFPRVLDFGVARARNRQSTTRDDRVKGKLAYMAPEQVMGEPLDGRTDVFSTSVVLWQALTGRRLFKAEHMVELAHKVLNMDLKAPSSVATDLGKRWDGIVMRGLERTMTRRWRDALAMAEALEAVGGMATNREVGLWVRRLGSDRLDELSAKITALEAKPVSETAKVKRRVHPRSQLHIDRTELEKAIREAQQSSAKASTPVDEARLVGPPAPEDTGDIVLPPPLPKSARGAAPRPPESAGAPPVPAHERRTVEAVVRSVGSADGEPRANEAPEPRRSSPEAAPVESASAAAAPRSSPLEGPVASRAPDSGPAAPATERSPQAQPGPPSGEAGADEAPASSVEAIVQPAAPVATKRTPGTRSRRKDWLLGIGTAAVIVALGTGFLLVRSVLSPSDASPDASAAAEQPTAGQEAPPEPSASTAAAPPTSEPAPVTSAPETSATSTSSADDETQSAASATATTTSAAAPTTRAQGTRPGGTRPPGTATKPPGGLYGRQ